MTQEKKKEMSEGLAILVVIAICITATYGGFWGMALILIFGPWGEEDYRWPRVVVNSVIIIMMGLVTIFGVSK